jgi:hypothetical protein
MVLVERESVRVTDFREQLEGASCFGHAMDPLVVADVDVGRVDAQGPGKVQLARQHLGLAHSALARAAAAGMVAGAAPARILPCVPAAALLVHGGRRSFAARRGQTQDD